jgi:endoglucanase
MKNILKFIVLGLLFVNISQLSAQNAFNKGVNLTGWFAASNARSIAFTKFTKKDFQNIKSMGCDVVRLPIELHSMTSGSPDYIVDPIFYNYLDQVIDWTEELQMNLIIDNHTIPDAKSKTVEIPLMKIWPQMANHYKGHSTLVFYEILNEPNTLLASDWAKIQQNVVDTIRTIDTKHTIIVTGADWGGIAGLTALKKLSDPNLIYSFHFYDPFLFTHQGASWASPSMADLSGVPFPYDAARIPACPASLKGTWIESSLKNSYKTDGTAAKLKSTLDVAIRYATTNNVKIFCGELGVYNQNSPELDRIEWYKTVPTYLTEKSIPWTMWDYQGGFGIFNKGSNELFEYDINRKMAEGMGFTPPPFKQYVMRADSVPFDVYTDFPGEGIIKGGSGDLFSSNEYEGNYSILLTELAQYNNLEFKFIQAKDLSKLVNANYTVDFWVKSDSPGSNVVLRFLDTKTADPKDHPWRRDVTLNSTMFPFDGQWHSVQIPLKKFLEAGSWDGSWFNSNNSFDWKAVDRFQIVAENMALTGKNFWFDNIRINGTPITGISENQNMNQFKAKAFPNPLTSETVIQYSLPASAQVEVCIFDLTGRKLQTLVNSHESEGIHQVRWTLGEKKSPDMKQGIYLCRISSEGRNEVIKLVVKE